MEKIIKKQENLRRILEKNRKFINEIGVERYASILKQLFIDWSSWRNGSFTDGTIEEIKNYKNYEVTYNSQGISSITIKFKKLNTSNGKEFWSITSSLMNIAFFKNFDHEKLKTEIPISSLYILKDLSINYEF